MTTSGPTEDEREVAASAFFVLNDLMGEIHAARVVGIRALRQPEVFQTKHVHFIIRIAIGATVLALRKLDDIWSAQIEPILLRDALPAEGLAVHREIEARRIRRFCNVVVAHYAASKIEARTNLFEIERLLQDQGFPSDEEFFNWTSDLLTKIEVVRDRIAERYGVTG